MNEDMSNSREYAGIERRNETEEGRTITGLQRDNDSLRRANHALMKENDRLTAKNASLELTVRRQKWGIVLIVAAVVAAGTAFVYNTMHPNKSNVPTLSQDTGQESTKPDYAGQAREIFRSFEGSYGEFVRAGAVEEVEFYWSEQDIPKSWRGRRIFPADRPGAGVISLEGLISGITSRLKEYTLEVNGNGTVFQAEYPYKSGFNPSEVIRSSFIQASSLVPPPAPPVHTQDTITKSIASRLESSSGSYGYARIVMKTKLPNVSVIAVFSLDPYAAFQHKKFLALGDGYIPAQSERDITQEIESRITIRRDINAAIFTVKGGGLSATDSLAGCVRKFAGQFAE